VAVGLAVMTKGFAAFLIFPIIWIYCLWARRLEILARSSYWIGVMVAVAIALPWHLYELWMHHAFFMKDVVIRHLFDRVITGLDGHVGNYYFYLRVLVNKFHPWILVGFFSAPYFLFKAIKDREEEIVFLTVWMFLVFIVVTAIRTKLAWYLFPVYPALSLSAAYFVSRVFRESSELAVKMMFLAILALHAPYSHIFDHDYSRDIKGIARAVISRVLPTQPVCLYLYHESPAVSFYIGRRSLYLDTKEDFLKKASEPHFSCLIHLKDLEMMGPAILGRFGLSLEGSFEDLRFITK
jgi:4-amino-4-deoxy-L-arabinose transferase-like glycosyltransferase